MVEMWQALDRMAYQSSQVYSANQVATVEIELVHGLPMAFLSASSHPKVSATILRMYINISQYRTSYHDLLHTLKQRVSNSPDPTRLLFVNTLPNILNDSSFVIAREHHQEMIEQFKYCESEFYKFLEETCQPNDYHFNTLSTINYGEYRFV